MSVLHRQQPVGSALTPVGENLRFVPRRSSRASRFADFSFQGLVWLSAAGVLAIVAFILTELIKGSSLSLHQFGWKFFIGSDWDPVNGNFGSVPFIYGTLVSSLVALIIAVPLSLGVAIFITEMCPRSLRGSRGKVAAPRCSGVTSDLHWRRRLAGQVCSLVRSTEGAC